MCYLRRGGGAAGAVLEACLKVGLEVSLDASNEAKYLTKAHRSHPCYAESIVPELSLCVRALQALR